MKRIALMLWGRGASSLYSAALCKFAIEKKYITVFSESPAINKGEFHYLHFDELDVENQFDLILYDIDDKPEFASSFPYVVQKPGILFLSNIFLHSYARAVSHSALDPWGYRWIVEQACPEHSDSLVRLAQDMEDPGALVKTVPLSPAPARRSVAVVVPDFENWRKLNTVEDMPAINIIPPPAGEFAEKGIESALSGSFEEFTSTVERMLTIWCEETKSVRETIAPLEHPHSNLFDVERQRILERFGEEDREIAEIAALSLSELFGDS